MQLAINIVTIVSATLMIALILAQSRGTGLGEAFGSDSSLYFSRRGVDLVMHQLTIIFALIFVLTITLGLIIG